MQLNFTLSKRVRECAARTKIVTEGSSPDDILVIREGWACQQRTLHDGRRQITGVLLPGDLCDSHMFTLKEADHTVMTLSPLVASALSRDALATLMRDIPQLTRALLWQTLVSAAIQREWTVSVGRRDATERIAHLFCELYYRLTAVGLIENDTMPMPMTQIDLADALGITNVHTNRTLQSMRSQKLIWFDRHQLKVLDLEALQRIAMFEGNYLHLEFKTDPLQDRGAPVPFALPGG